jgi:hypothetical protein
MEIQTRMQHISNQKIRDCNQIKSVSQTSLRGDTQSNSLSSFPWGEKLIESLIPTIEEGGDPVDNPWHFI